MLTSIATRSNILFQVPALLITSQVFGVPSQRCLIRDVCGWAVPQHIKVLRKPASFSHTIHIL